MLDLGLQPSTFSHFVKGPSPEIEENIPKIFVRSMGPQRQLNIAMEIGPLIDDLASLVVSITRLYFFIWDNIWDKNIKKPPARLYLVGGLEHFLFSIIYGIILPID